DTPMSYIKQIQGWEKQLRKLAQSYDTATDKNKVSKEYHAARNTQKMLAAELSKRETSLTRIRQMAVGANLSKSTHPNSLFLQYKNEEPALLTLAQIVLSPNTYQKWHEQTRGDPNTLSAAIQGRLMDIKRMADTLNAEVREPTNQGSSSMQKQPILEQMATTPTLSETQNQKEQSQPAG